MKTQLLSALLAGAVLATAVPAGAQVIPDFIEHRVPTAPFPGPLQTKKRLADYIVAGYAVYLSTRIDGLFEGCSQGQELYFQDGTRFDCDETLPAEEMSPRAYVLRNPITRSYVLFVGKSTYVGRILRLKNRKLRRVIHAGDAMIGIPSRNADERRSIGPVDVTNGMIAPIGRSRSPYAASVQELTSAPPSPPPAHVTLNPMERDSVNKIISTTGAPPR